MDGLPTEIKLAIVSHVASFDGQIESRSLIPQIPVSLASSSVKYPALKSLSLLNGQWRSLTRPHLFSRLVLRMGGGTSGNFSTSTRFRMAMKDAADSLEGLPLPKTDMLAQVDSLVVEIDPPIVSGTQSLRNPAKHSTDIITMYDFWRRIFESVDPTRLAILGPVSVLGWLTTTVTQMRDAWGFGDMETQMLELTQNHRRPLLTSGLRSRSRSNAAWDTEYLFNARSWTGLKLNEGSMLQAYGIYEYFNRVPPTILDGVILPRSESLESFSLHCLFPFNTHVDELQLLSLSHYRRIHFHFTPAPNMQVLDNSKMVGKADLVDCWREVEQIYQRTLEQQSLFGPDGLLEEFSTGDHVVESIRRILDDGFIEHAQHGWVPTGFGRWTRSQMSNADS
ncbi:hypothetical protein C1H76_9623 [Elsinoe australis]|uniref:F-box domain-containing protein n=1 Tax=Elsinoe australis TaxID=40998 RepID=A0A4U7ANW1_9PEZI|nr:hypothetical protein C1H76_9623 [Elsinoe australis]